VGAVDSRAGADHASLTWEDYARAERFLPWNAAKLVSGLEIDPHWIDGGDAFWYRASTPSGPRFVRVDPAVGSKEPAFDHVRLAAGLSRASGVSAAGDNLPFEEFDYENGGAAVGFMVDGQRWVCDLTSYECAPGNGPQEDEAPADVSRSPDGTNEVFVRDHNLWIRAVSSGKERALTTDGEAGYAYGSPITSPLVTAGIGDPEKPVAIWSADSTRFVSCRIDQRRAKLFHLVQSVPKDGSTRPVLHTYAYPLPGDEEVPGAEVRSFAVEGEEPVKAAVDPLPMLYHGYPLSENAVWWSADSTRYHLLTRDRGFRAYRLWEIDASTGAARQVIEERAERGIEPYLFWGDVNVRVLANGNEILWYAQREGWGHLYLYGTDGTLIRQLTTGPYNVASVAHIDDAGRWLYFTAMGREPDSDPYYSYLYRVSLDGGEPELLTPENGEHAVSFSPSGRFVLDTYSRVDQPPVTVLRTSAGAVVSELERADISALTAAGYTLPERFSAKARDGRTDVYGVLLRPSNFDPNRVYPVINYIYAGPQVNVAPTSFADAAPFGDSRRAGRGRGYWHAQALAELGFVVVMVDGLGMPGRSKAYHDVSYRNLGDGGIADHVAAIRQLADRYRYIDVSRVGIYGHSAGGYASARAILTFPDFYKVCVSSAGNHDHLLDKAGWVERYMALPIEDHYRDQANKTHAGNLKGKLLLIHGEMDENVHPASTLALVDALIKENKDFDLLIIPNRPHRMDNDPYFVRRRWDYFVRHLLGAEPPEGYRIRDEAEA
jgi:dipeptidyl-peptidase-4